VGEIGRHNRRYFSTDGGSEVSSCIGVRKYTIQMGRMLADANDY